MTVTCYCLAEVCGRADLADGDRWIHLDAQLVHGDAAWGGSYDFGSFACLAVWARDRSDDHDGLRLTSAIDASPVPDVTPPADEAYAREGIAWIA